MAEEFWESYKHPLWQKKRLEILERAEYKCESCGSGDKQLHVHHSYYVKDRAPWEYPNQSLHSLCDECHNKYQTLKRQTNEMFGKATLAELHQIFGYMNGLFSKRHPGFPRIVQPSTAKGFADAWDISLDELMEIQSENGGVCIQGISVEKYLGSKSGTNNRNADFAPYAASTG